MSESIEVRDKAHFLELRPELQVKTSDCFTISKRFTGWKAYKKATKSTPYRKATFTFFCWRLEKVIKYDEPVQIPKPMWSGGNPRFLKLSLERLGHVAFGGDLALFRQTPSLYASAECFLERLSAEDQRLARSLATFLNRRVVPFATTCSGLDGARDAFTSLMSALAHKFNVRFYIQFLFCMEKSPSKQRHILRAFKEAPYESQFVDVKAIRNGGGRCFPEEAGEKQLSPVRPALVVAGPVCKDVSTERQDYSSLAGCLESGTGITYETFQGGVFDVVEVTDPGLVIWECTKGILDTRSDKDGTRGLLSPSSLLQQKLRPTDR